MPLHPAFRPPTRVSRLYPLMTLALMIGSSSLVYAWQNTQLSGDAAIQERDRKIQELTLKDEQLTAQSKIDKASIQSQTAQIDQITTQLKTVEEDLANKTQQLKDAQTQLDNQKEQLSANASELENLRNRPPLFSFQNKSSLADIELKEAEVKNVVTAAYSYIQDLYGRPYALNSITITFVDTFSIANASGEIEISNGASGISIDIHIKDFHQDDFEDVNTIIHEMIHGFHGIGVLDPSALEEGITVAATDVVMARMIADKKIPQFSHLYLIINDTQYQTYNNQLTVRANTDAFYSDPQIAKVYQLIGATWFKLYKENNGFFKSFNDAYYAKIQKGLTVDAAGVRDIIAGILPSVGGTSIQQFFQDNHALTPQ